VNDEFDLSGWFRNSPVGNTTYDYRGAVLGKGNNSLNVQFLTGGRLSDL